MSRAGITVVTFQVTVAPSRKRPVAKEITVIIGNES